MSENEKTAKHTPGPWRHEPYEGSHESAIIGGLHQIATVQYDDWDHSHASLIAAAPDLLKELTDLLAMCERQKDFNDDGDGMMFDRARAAIRKAIGGGHE